MRVCDGEALKPCYSQIPDRSIWLEDTAQSFPHGQEGEALVQIPALAGTTVMLPLTTPLCSGTGYAYSTVYAPPTLKKQQ